MTDTKQKLAVILDCLPASPFKEQVRGVHTEILVEIESLQARVADLEKKLEVDPQSNWDGIDCRDETIKLLEAKVEALKLEAKIDAEGPDWIQRALQAEAALEMVAMGQGEPVYKAAPYWLNPRFKMPPVT